MNPLEQQGENLIQTLGHFLNHLNVLHLNEDETLDRSAYCQFLPFLSQINSREVHASPIKVKAPTGEQPLHLTTIAYGDPDNLEENFGD